MAGQSDLNDLHYVGYVLGLGLVPMFDNMTVRMAARRVPIVRAARELRGSRMVDAKVRPAWWLSASPTGVEAYTLTKGGFGLIPVMSRQGPARRETITFDTAPLGVAAGRRMYLWVNAVSMPSGRSGQPAEAV